MRNSLRIVLAFLLAGALTAQGADQEAATSRFLAEVFATPPQAREIVLVGDLRPVVRAILEHDYPRIRVRYWRSGERTAWVLDEIGKEMPITVGVSVDKDAIEQMRVLVYRESRGGEVRHPAFTRQFDGARLAGDRRLDREIDGIAGATLSVRALQRLGWLALYLHRQVTAGEAR